MWWSGGAYWTATRHPWSCVLFVLPLLAVYEVGLYVLGPAPAALLRNGADTWLRTGLTSAGMSAVYGAPVALLLVLLVWTLLHREQTPSDPVGVWIGMAVESVAFAGLLYGMSQAAWPVFHSVKTALDESAGRVLALAITASPSESSAGQPDYNQLVRTLARESMRKRSFGFCYFRA